MTISEVLKAGSQQLETADITSARLDCLVLLSDLLEHDKSWLLAHDDFELTNAQQAEFAQNITQRAQRQPLAYLRGTQEFYGRDFAVSHDVLIPRPETEHIIELLAQLGPKNDDRLLDVGTGSGAIAITAKLENPGLQVTASDISDAALAIAKQNAASLKADIDFSKSDLLNNLTGQFNFITANLPYVDRGWRRSPETDFEPALALFAHDGGLELIKKLLTQAKTVLKTGDYILLEADPCQMPAIESYAKNLDYQKVSSRDFAIVLQLL